MFQVVESTHDLPSADMYILEEQSHRIGGGSGFLGISLRLRALEAMTYGVLRSKNSHVYSILPVRVSNYLELSETKAKSKLKKKKAVALVQQLLLEGKETPFGDIVTASEEQLNYFSSQKKKDDLSDCLLQAVAVLDWSHMSRQL